MTETRKYAYALHGTPDALEHDEFRWNAYTATSKMLSLPLSASICSGLVIVRKNFSAGFLNSVESDDIRAPLYLLPIPLTHWSDPVDVLTLDEIARLLIASAGMHLKPAVNKISAWVVEGESPFERIRNTAQLPLPSPCLVFASQTYIGLKESIAALAEGMAHLPPGIGRPCSVLMTAAAPPRDFSSLMLSETGAAIVFLLPPDSPHEEELAGLGPIEHLVTAPADDESYRHAEWEDVAGCEEAKLRLDSLLLGETRKRGVLLCGPPGTGKTLLARAFASRSNKRFVHIGGPSLLSPYLGETERKLAEVLRTAAEGDALLFIDECDSVLARPKQEDSGIGARVISTFLQGLDSFPVSSIIVAATNRDDLLDPAVLRVGRLDYRVEVGLPRGPEARAEVLRTTFRCHKWTSDVVWRGKVSTPDEVPDSVFNELEGLFPDIESPAEFAELWPRKEKLAAQPRRVAIAALIKILGPALASRAIEAITKGVQIGEGEFYLSGFSAEPLEERASAVMQDASRIPPMKVTISDNNITISDRGTFEVDGLQYLVSKTVVNLGLS